jgi:hypothetical protein
MRRLFAALAGVAALCATGGVSRAEDAVTWKEVQWPFLRDAWPNGRAFECVGAGCGSGLSLYARVKNGFCDCTRGVADDDEIDRVGDVDLVALYFKPLAASLPRDLAGMAGRTRLYEVPGFSTKRVVSLAGGRDCNAFVAMAVGGRDMPANSADLAAAFINTPTFSQWIARKQGGE